MRQDSGAVGIKCCCNVCSVTCDSVSSIQTPVLMPICQYLTIDVQVYPLDISTCYSQTSLIRASLIIMPHNPNTLPGNLFYHFLITMIQ